MVPRNVDFPSQDFLDDLSKNKLEGQEFEKLLYTRYKDEYGLSGV